MCNLFREGYSFLIKCFFCFKKSKLYAKCDAEKLFHSQLKSAIRTPQHDNNTTQDTIVHTIDSMFLPPPQFVHSVRINGGVFKQHVNPSKVSVNFLDHSGYRVGQVIKRTDNAHRSFLLPTTKVARIINLYLSCLAVKGTDHIRQ